MASSPLASSFLFLPCPHNPYRTRFCRPRRRRWGGGFHVVIRFDSGAVLAPKHVEARRAYPRLRLMSFFNWKVTQKGPSLKARLFDCCRLCFHLEKTRSVFQKDGFVAAAGRIRIRDICGDIPRRTGEK